MFLSAGDIPNWTKKGPKTEIIKEFLGGLLDNKEKGDNFNPITNEYFESSKAG